MDGRLRELERRWQESLGLEDEIRFRVEQVRGGTLTQDRLTLAAYCGDGAALRVLLGFGVMIDSPSDLRSWVKTVAQEIHGWRVPAWLLHAGLHEAYKVWSGARLQESSGPGACVGRVVSGLRVAADSGFRSVFDERIQGLTDQIEQHAARERMWDGAGQEGFVVHLAFRAIEIMVLERWSHTGEIVDRCAQAVHRILRGHDELPSVRRMMKQAIKVHLIKRAFGTSGPLNGYPEPLPSIPIFVEATNA